MNREKFVIELGSSNTVIYKVGYGIVLKEPSIVAVSKTNSKQFAVGIQAKKMQGKMDDSVTICEPITHGIVTNQKMATLMLHGFLQKVCTNPKNADVIFCVSIGLTDEELLAFKNLALQNEITNISFENVCLAGLKGANVSVDKSISVACVNLGGGTCNFAVISLGKTIEGFSIDFGGKDIDSAIIEHFRAVKNVEFSKIMAEKIKNECLSLYLMDKTNMEVGGIDADTKRPITEIVTATEVRDATLEFFEKIRQAIEHLLFNCTTDIIGDITKNGIYVVGGLANITGLESYLSKNLNLPITIPDEPENCTILGALM